jgi:hypothetical protein
MGRTQKNIRKKSKVNRMKLTLTLFFLLLTLISFAQMPNYVPSNGLVGWWPFNGNANDESGNGNNGTVNGATLTADRFGVANKAYSFGSNFDEIILNNFYLSNSLKFSFAGWYRKNSSSINQEGSIFSLSNPCDGPGGLRATIGGNNTAGSGANGKVLISW